MWRTKIWKSVFFSANLHVRMELELAPNWDRIHTIYKASLDSLVETPNSLEKHLKFYLVKGYAQVT